MEWRNQVAVVTGGARGIGRATARLLAQRGAAVCVNYGLFAFDHRSGMAGRNTPPAETNSDAERPTAWLG
jgi:NAD(P)-dependent dehydrogenase (short-subunit alcohol dehydrogenase family)